MRALDLSGLRRTCSLALLLAGGTAALAAGNQVAQVTQVTLVSRVDPAGASDTASGAGNQILDQPSTSRDGRYVAFLSEENNLVSGQVDQNADGGQESNDVFLYDRVARTPVLVSHDAASLTTGGNHGSNQAAISADGRWVVFASQSTNLVHGLPDDFSRQVRLFLYDRVSAAVTLVSSSASLGIDGGFSVGVTTAALSADGRFIAFASTAPDLVPGQQDDNQGADVFLYDRTTRRTVLVSHAGTPAATLADSVSPYLSLSADGRFVAFNRRPIGGAGGFPGDGDGDVLLYDRLSAAVSRIAAGGVPTISADGGSIAFLSSGLQVIPGQVDANGAAVDVFLYSRATRQTVLVSHAAGRPTTTGNGLSDPVTGGGSFLAPLLSADGRTVAFWSRATNLVPRQAGGGSGDLFLYDRTTATVSLVSRKGNSPRLSTSGVLTATMSADGRFIAFATLAVDEVPRQADFDYGPDVFLFDRRSGNTALVSFQDAPLTPLPRTGDFPSYGPAISADGSQIAFYSAANNLVPGLRDLNGGADLLLYDVRTRGNTLVTLHAPSLPSLTPDVGSFLRGLSADGRWVVLEGSAANLVPLQIDANNQSDVFLYDARTRKTALVSHASGAPATAGDAPSYQSSLSADGRFVVFTSYATNLDPAVRDYQDPATTQRRFDVFLFDRTTRKNLALSRSALHPGLTGDFDSEQPVISADGHWVAFLSSATDLVPAGGTATGNVYLYDRVAQVLTRANAGAGSTGAGKPLAISADGRYLLTLSRSLYLYDRVTGTNTLVSHDRSGAPAEVVQDETPVLSADGRFVAFTSGRRDLGSESGEDINVYLWDREGGGVTFLGGSSRASRGFAPRQPALSADGLWVAFLSNAEAPAPGFDNPGRTDQVMLYDQSAGIRTLLTPSALLAGQASQGTAASPLINADGRYVAFAASGDPSPDGSATEGLFLYDRIAGTASLAARMPYYTLAFTGGSAPRLSADGRAIAFQSRWSGLVPGDFNGVRDDVFLATP
jgi:Tol biopolymer transport system component